MGSDSFPTIRDEGLEQWWADGPMTTGTNLIVKKLTIDFLPAVLTRFVAKLASQGTSIAYIDTRDANFEFRLTLIREMRPDLLVMDNLYETPSSEEMPTFRSLVDSRYVAQKPTMVLTTKDVSDLRAALGAYISSRLFESADSITIVGGLSHQEWREI